MERLGNAAPIRAALDNMLDTPLVRHGFMPYNRDYAVVYEIPESATGPDQGCSFTYLFRACVEAHYTGSFHHSMFPLNDDFIDYERWRAAGEPDGFVWGVNWADHYPGATYIDGSARAAFWSDNLQVPMHEIRIITNTFTLELVFHELEVRRIAPV